MTEILFLLTGLLLSGCLSIGILCCIQIKRIRDHEREISRLKMELRKKQ